MKKAGFVGLGIMGSPMAKNLLKGGCELMVYDLNPKVVDEFVALGAQAGSLAQIGSDCEIIFTILPNGAIVQSVLFGENGISSTIKRGAVVCDMSSVTPTESKICAEKLAHLGVGFIDSPVSGGEPKAIDGTLAFMAGGTGQDFDKLQPYMDIMGASALLIGPTGSGSITKLTNQVIVNLTIATVSEAFVLAAKAGADPVKVYQAIRGGLAGSTVLDAKIPMIVERNFKPGGKISINHKDIKNVMATAHDIDVPMPLTAQLFEIMQALKVSGHMDDDHGGIVQYFEQLAGVEVKKIQD
ncbi:MAG: 2-hydroxy-3-oxopropionate reductase [Anaerotignaceae bacterium]